MISTIVFHLMLIMCVLPQPAFLPLRTGVDWERASGWCHPGCPWLATAPLASRMRVGPRFRPWLASPSALRRGPSSTANKLCGMRWACCRPEAFVALKGRGDSQQPPPLL